MKGITIRRSITSAMQARPLLPSPTVKVRLTKKFAEQIDGVRLEGHHIGDVIDLPETQARLLLAEDWATTEERRHLHVDPPLERRHHETTSRAADDSRRDRPSREPDDKEPSKAS